MEIRQLLKSEIPEALSLVWKMFTEFEAPDFSAEGINTFKACLNDDDFIGGLEIFGAYENGELVGVLATRSMGGHISLFFVHRDHHRKGIGRKLFEYVLPKSTGEKMTVNSSPYAVEVYHKLGFADTNTELIKDGIRFTPMEYII